MVKKPTEAKIKKTSEKLGELDDYLISEGRHQRLWEALGAHVIDTKSQKGVHLYHFVFN